MISRFNGSDLSIELEDVEDQRPVVNSPAIEGSASFRTGSPKVEGRRQPMNTTVFDAGQLEDDPHAGTAQSSQDSSRAVTDYHAVGESPTALDTHVFQSPVAEHPPTRPHATENKLDDVTTSAPRLRPSLNVRQSRRLSTASSRRASSIYEKRGCGMLPRWARRPLLAWGDRVMLVLSPEWLRTTLLVWVAWWAMSLG